MLEKDGEDAPWLAVARHFAGEAEVPGAASSPVIREMFALCGHSDVTRDETPWCAAFVGACLALSGWRNTGSLMARSYLRFGKKLAEPRPGAVAVFWRGRPDSSAGHVGFFLADEGARIRILGGNQSDRVSVTTLPKTRLLGYRWPEFPVPLPETVLPTIAEMGFLPGIFDKAVNVIFAFEGGYSDHPRDPGGATKFGITRRTLQHWRSRPASKSDVRNLQPAEAKDIYRSNYWNRISGDRLYAPLALVLFNAAVLSGPGRAVKLLQEVLNRQGFALAVDGDMGPKTLSALRRSSQARLPEQFTEHFRSFLRGLKGHKTFGRGWEKRLQTCLRIARTQAANHQGDTGMNNGSLPETDTLVLLQKTIEELADLSAKVDRLAEGHQEPGRDGLTAIDRLLGGRFLTGRKTVLAAVAFVGLEIWRMVSGIDPAAGGQDAEIYSLLLSVISAFGGLGLISKAERAAGFARNSDDR